MVASEGARPSAEKKEPMNEQYQAIVDRLNAFSASRDVDALVQVERAIERLPITETTDSTGGKEQRRTKLELWLKLLDKSDQMIDPKFDRDDVPQMNIAPPPSTGLSAGASPSAIKDPTLRQDYERAIELNNEKAERYQVQTRLRELDKALSAKVSAFIKNQYTSQAQDVDEVNSLIDKLLSSIPRREQMKRVLLSTK